MYAIQKPYNLSLRYCQPAFLVTERLDAVRAVGRLRAGRERLEAACVTRLAPPDIALRAGATDCFAFFRRHSSSSFCRVVMAFLELDVLDGVVQRTDLVALRLGVADF